MLEVVICTFNMEYELQNTIKSCLPPFQQVVTTDNYRILILDNGSDDHVSYNSIVELSENIRLIKSPFKSVSPTKALNWVIRNYCDSDYLMICIDGARMFSANLLEKSFQVHSNIPNAFVYSISYHIGNRSHQELAKEGFTLDEARQFLTSINWEENSKTLLNNSVLALSSKGGYFSSIAESNAFSVSRFLFEEIGGFDERFLTPGGGYCNLEIFQRYVHDPRTVNVCLLNEGTFHQYHGGASTGRKVSPDVYSKEYIQIFKKPFKVEKYLRFYF